MGNLFSTLLAMSIAGSAVVGLMLLLRPVTMKIFSAKWQYGIGKMAIAFFLLPVSLIVGKVSFVLPQTITPRHPSGTPLMAIPEALRPNGFADAIDTLVEKQLPAAMEKHLPLEVIGAVLFIWLAGVIVFAGWHFYCYRRFSKQLRADSFPVSENTTTAALLSSCKAALGIHSEVRLMMNPKIKSPMLVGLRSPMILLPISNMRELDLKLVLTHELMHLKRKDLWVKMLALLAGTVHWFNPLAHVLCRDISTWCELSCDEALACDMSHEERKHYGEAILNTLDNHSGMNTAFYSPLCESKKHIKRRLIRMLNVKKTKKYIAVLAVAAILAIGGTGLALAAGSTGNDIDNVINVSVDKQNDNNSDVKYLWPVTGHNRISAAYGTRMHPVKKEMVFCNGIDISAPESTPVLAADKGTVAETGNNETDGNYVILNHGGGIQTFYSKLFGFAEGLAEGDTVQQGDVIGYVGQTGEATGPHLHFVLTIDGEYIDPASVFASEDLEYSCKTD